MGSDKILVTGPSWIGDMVMAQSMFKLMLQADPNLVIDVLAPPWTLPVVERMPEVRRAIAFPSRHGKLDLLMRIKTGLALGKESYSESIVIPRSLKSAIPSLLAGIRKRTGLGKNFGMINNVREYLKSREYLYVRRLLTLVSDEAYTLPWSDIPKPKLHIDPNQVKVLLEQWGLSNKQFVVFAPGAEFGPAKQWPAEHFAALSALLEKDDLRVVIMGSRKDHAIAASIISSRSAQNIVDLTGKTTLTEVIDLMSAASAVVANDSGLMHLAAATSRIVAIYGSSSPIYTPPLAEADRVLIQSAAMECSPCFARQCRYKHYQCLYDIDAEQVYQSLRRHAWL